MAVLIQLQAEAGVVRGGLCAVVRGQVGSETCGERARGKETAEAKIRSTTGGKGRRRQHFDTKQRGDGGRRAEGTDFLIRRGAPSRDRSPRSFAGTRPWLCARSGTGGFI